MAQKIFYLCMVYRNFEYRVVIDLEPVLRASFFQPKAFHIVSHIFSFTEEFLYTQKLVLLRTYVIKFICTIALQALRVVARSFNINTEKSKFHWHDIKILLVDK